MNRAFDKVLKSHIILAVLSVFAVVLLSGGITYSLFQIDNRNTTNQTITVGTLSGELTSITGGIVISDLYPQTASEITDQDKKYSFTISNTGTYDLNYTIYLKDATDELLESSTEYSSYKRISESHYRYINYKLDGEKVANLVADQNEDKFIVMTGSIKAGKREDHTLQFFLDNKDTTQTGAPNDIAGSVISLDIYMDASATRMEPTIIDNIIASSKGVRTDFDSIATTDEGVYEMLDDYGTSYYFRGAVTNNYVKFGKNKDGSDMYWRIIRVNGDGSLRMIYDGTSAHANGESSDDRLALTGIQWNPNYDDAKYVGYMFGGANGVASTSKAQAQTNQTNSNIKTQVDTWYKENIVDTGYSEYISDEIFCNDRSIPGKSVSQWTSDTGLGYAKNATAYGAFGRFLTGNNSTSIARRSNPSPKFTCSQKNDAFTVSDTERGNGALTYPVGLITADEIITAGGRYYMSDNSSSNNKYYLYKSSGNWYWSLSPYYFSGTTSRVFRVYNTGAVNRYDVHGAGAVVPVINLSTENSATLEGAGSAENPYVLSTGQL